MTDMYKASVDANAVSSLDNYATITVARTVEKPDVVTLTTKKELSADPRKHVTVVAYLSLAAASTLGVMLTDATNAEPPTP